MIEILFSFTLFLIIIMVLTSELYSRKTMIPPVPTLPKTKRQIIRLLKKHLNQSKPYKFAELGSGWGGLCFSIMKNFPKASLTGFELSPFPYWISIMRFWTRGAPPRLRFSRTDFYKENLGEFDVIICYLSPHHMNLLKGQLQKQLSKNCLIISNAFPIPGWKDVEKINVSNLGYKTNIYLYRS